MATDILDDLAGDDRVIASTAPAHERDVAMVLSAPKATGNGRSEWFWLRLSNGDLFLAVAPQGETYELLEGRTEV